MAKLVVVDTISSHLIRYVVRVEDEDPADYALDTVVWNESDPEKLREFSQKHLGYHVASHRVISEEEYLEMFDKDNDYLKSWPTEKKLEFISDK
jgi:hypothetical protein